MYHSQHKIEEYLERFFDAPGFFLEIGCWDGELISQTAWLEREKGWTGVCVDPFPRNFKKRLCRVLAYAVSKFGQQSRQFVKVSVDRRDGGDVSYFSGFKDSLTRHWELIEKYCDYEIVSVPGISLDNLYDLMNLPTYIEFLSVDTEGSELEIFESINFDRWSFGLIVFEHNEDEAVKQRIGELLAAHGYVRVAEMRCDDVWVNGEIFDNNILDAQISSIVKKIIPK